MSSGGGMVVHRSAASSSSHEPLAGVVISIALSMLSNSVISGFIAKRSVEVKCWRRLPPVQWLVFAIYIDSYLFVFATSILQFGFGVNYSAGVCQGAILLCLVCYVTTKILIYLFLVERAYIIRPQGKRRMRSKLYLFNSFGMIGVYSVIVVLNFVFRIARFDAQSECIIGMRKLAMIPLITFDLLVNVYLTILFLIPLSGLHSFKDAGRTRFKTRLRGVAKRTFIGCLCTLASSIVNLMVLMIMDGEPAWICLMCCNSDILLGAIVIQWITSKDNTESLSLTDFHSPLSLPPISPNQGDGAPEGLTGHPGEKRNTWTRRLSASAAAAVMMYEKEEQDDDLEINGYEVAISGAHRNVGGEPSQLKDDQIMPTSITVPASLPVSRPSPLGTSSEPAASRRASGRRSWSVDDISSTSDSGVILHSPAAAHNSSTLRLSVQHRERGERPAHSTVGAGDDMETPTATPLNTTTIAAWIPVAVTGLFSPTPPEPPPSPVPPEVHVSVGYGSVLSRRPRSSDDDDAEVPPIGNRTVIVSETGSSAEEAAAKAKAAAEAVPPLGRWPA